jgi:hypothetical protein
MNRSFLWIAVLGSGWWGANVLLAQQELPPPEPRPVVVPAADHFEPLTRGPVHEAFAQGATTATNDWLVIRKEPPPVIDEIPPAQRPAGDDIAWIPGYWGWDDEREDFIWISGIWRAIPPGREWVPGYWARVPGGYQWISGYWADTRLMEVEYLPPPPETAEAGPTTAPPTGDEIWIPGTWLWQNNRYVWRPGYWAKGDPRWVWTNARYVYTPRGYLFVSGFWDYLPDQRGLLFAPVYFQGPVPRNYVYSPRLVVSTALLLEHLFLRPSYGHYYYGDYYAAPYRTRGILPFYVFNDNRRGYDPLYAWQRWQHRQDREWERRLAARYDALRDREDGRPPRDWATWERRRRDNDRTPLFSAIQDFSRSAGGTWKFRDLADDARRDVGRLSRDFEQYRQQRLKAEAEAAARTGENRGPDRVRLLKPPIGDPASRPGPNLRDRIPGADVLPGRDLPGRDVPGRDVPGRNVLPGRGDRDERDGRPRLERDSRDTPQPEPRPGVIRPDTPRPDAPRPDRPRVDTPRPDTPRPGVPRADTPRPEPPRGDAPKGDRPKTETPRPSLTPRPNPMPTPRPEPRAEPRPDPKPAPRPQAAPRPQPQPQTQPAPQPRPQPQPQPGSQPRAERPERPSAGPAGTPNRPKGGGERPNRGKKD